MLRHLLIGAALLAPAALALPVLAPSDGRPEVSVHRDTRAELRDVNLLATVATAQAQAGDSEGLPATWCGDQLTVDDAANAVFPASAPQFKVVYAFAADRPNRFAGWSDALQADVAVSQRFLSAQGGGTKAIRFDMGTRCGPHYADIQVVALPGPHSSYAGDFGAITTAVQRALGPAGGPRNTVILADGLSASGFEYGLGETVMGPSGQVPGAANVHNLGGLRSVLFSRDGGTAPGASRGGWWPEGFLHEITHNLGAVQWTAPHSTQPQGQGASRYGHCWQGADLMCYVEDAGAAHAMQTDCATIAGTIAQSYDCGRDDYFNPAPAAGSYLATHWNSYDSAFLAACGEIAPACGGGELWVPTPPAATASPAVTGAARRGTVLQTSAGTWINQPDGYAYQWQRLAAGRWTNIGRATGARYRLATPDLGGAVRVTVAASNRDGTTAAASAPTVPVGAVALGRSVRAESRRHRAHAPAR